MKPSQSASRFPSIQERTVHGLARPAAEALLVASLMLGAAAQAQTRARTELPFPDLPGFVTVRGDFHMHTVFSDGNVWPTTRAEEAWRNGLDAIALTDHLEYTPHTNDLPVSHGRSCEIARVYGEPLGLTVIRAAEITRGEPPGHLNALFLTNVAIVNQTNNAAAVRAAFEQGAFIFWNHPGWKQPNQKSVWYAEQEQFFTNGWLRGLEIVNGQDYDPIAHQWCLDRKLTMVANSDAHDPVGFEYGPAPEELRPMTLVFAQARTAEALREALFARRTAVVSGGRLIGEARYLEPLFHGSLEWLKPEIRIRGKGRASVQIRNRAPLNYRLKFNSKPQGLSTPSSLVLAGGKVSVLEIRSTTVRPVGEEEIVLPCQVENALVTPEAGLRTSLKLKIQFEAEK